MAGPKKRASDTKQHGPSKKQKRQQRYHSDSESDDDQTQSFSAVNPLGSDDDVRGAAVDDAPDQAGRDDDSSGSEDERPLTKKRTKPTRGASQPAAVAVSGEEDEDDGDDDDDEADANQSDSDPENPPRKPRSKRNDPAAFATSISKILSTKLPTSRRADPVLSRSAAAHEASRAVVDGALEARARRHMKEQKRKALEKGRIRDVLVAGGDAPDAAESTGRVLEVERRLRKVAQRGVVKLFNAVRAAQVKAGEAEKEARREGVVGVKNREEKVNELSKKGFLDLIASGGGALKRGGLEEA